MAKELGKKYVPKSDGDGYDRIDDKVTLFNLAYASEKEWIGSCKSYPEYLDVLEKLFKP